MVFKIKMNGVKQKFRPLDNSEVICKGDMFTFIGDDEFNMDRIKDYTWHETKAIGDRPSEHPERYYIRKVIKGHDDI